MRAASGGRRSAGGRRLFKNKTSIAPVKNGFVGILNLAAMAKARCARAVPSGVVPCRWGQAVLRQHGLCGTRRAHAAERAVVSRDCAEPCFTTCRHAWTG
eukprot:scaffold11884_cov106-Isochrysis_galbana.AAC.5